MQSINQCSTKKKSVFSVSRNMLHYNILQGLDLDMSFCMTAICSSHPLRTICLKIVALPWIGVYVEFRGVMLSYKKIINT